MRKCAGCEWNDDNLCDKYGILVNDDDECIKPETAWLKEYNEIDLSSLTDDLK